MNIIQILIGSLALSLIHTSIPNHWLPLVTVSKAQNWSRTKTLWITAIAGLAHSISTILVGIVIGLIGYRLSSDYELLTKIVASLILIALGVVYIIVDLKNTHYCQDPAEPISQRSEFAIITSLITAMFFSPCIEIEAYYFSAGALGWPGIIVVSGVYLIITIFGMLLLVDLSRKGIEKIRCSILEYHEKRLTGSVLIILGLLAYFIN